MQKISYSFFVLLLSVFYYTFLSKLSFSSVQVADDIYRLSESNGIATSICKAIDMSTVLMVPLFAIMFTIIGFGAFQGNVKWSSFVTFAIGIAAFKGAGNLAEIFMPQMGLQYGCKCAIEKQIRDNDGNIKMYATGLNYDCTEGTQDYEEEYNS